MASKNLYFFDTKNPQPSYDDTLFEFDESDTWSTNNTSTPSNNATKFEAKKLIPSSRVPRQQQNRYTHTCASSLPVNIPDWSRIYQRTKEKHLEDDTEYGEEEIDCNGDTDQASRLPPHEYLARKRGASFSVHEGIGRTLKGRDLRQVRNAVWKKVGFED